LAKESGMEINMVVTTDFDNFTSNVEGGSYR